MYTYFPAGNGVSVDNLDIVTFVMWETSDWECVCCISFTDSTLA